MTVPEIAFDPRLGGKDKHGSRYRDPRTGLFLPASVSMDKESLSGTREITFKCKFCGESKPLDQMRTLTRFFPQLVACKACEQRVS